MARRLGAKYDMVAESPLPGELISPKGSHDKCERSVTISGWRVLGRCEHDAGLLLQELLDAIQVLRIEHGARAVSAREERPCSPETPF